MADEIFKLRYGRKSFFDQIEEKDDNTLYFVTDIKKIFRGGVDYTGNIDNITLGNDVQGNGKRMMTIALKEGDDITVDILNSSAINAIIEVLNGQASDTAKGLVKLTDTIDNTSAKDGVAVTSKAVKDYVAAGFAANDAMVFKGTIGADGTITSEDTNINGKKISAITGYSAGWTFRATAASTAALWTEANTTKVEAGDMIVAVKDYGTSNVATDWSIVQSNLIGAVTTDSTALTADQLILGGGTQKVKPLTAGSAGQVVTMVNGKPAWANLPTEKDTTYTFENGTDGSFTVTPSEGIAQKVSIGKPATAGTADVALKGRIGGADKAFGAAAGYGVETTLTNNEVLITSAAVYDALKWKSFEE